MTKAAFNNMTYKQIGLKFKKEIGKVLHKEHTVVWCRKLDISAS